MTAPAVLRPYAPEDLDAAVVLGHAAMEEAGGRYGWPTTPMDEHSRARARQRHEHLLRTDPGGCWLAEADGELVGLALSLRRESLWFLSALAVAPSVQARGVGRALLEATLAYGEGTTAGMIMSSSDPKALRRYGAAGFALLPGYDVSGPVDRALLPAVADVREGDWQRDGERVDDLVRGRRGAAYGPDLAALAGTGVRLLLAPDGCVGLRGGHVVLLAAETAGSAQALLWAVLAEADELSLHAVTGAQQWAVEVVLAARLTLTPGSSLCTRGDVGPLTPYLPSGAYG